MPRQLKVVLDLGMSLYLILSVPTRIALKSIIIINGKNQLLVTNEPVEFETSRKLTIILEECREHNSNL